MPNGNAITVDQAFNVAISLHQSGKVSRAADIYNLILKKESKHADALHLLGVTRRQQGKIKEAVKLIKSAIKINPDACIYYSNLSEAYRVIDKLSKASDACQKALKLDSQHPETHLNMAAIAFAKQNYEVAITSYTKALDYRNGYVDALFGLGDTFIKLGQVENGLKNYQQILTYQPNNVAALTRIGIALRILERVDEAVEHYKKAINQLPDEPDLYNNLSFLYQRIGDKSEAASCLRKLLKLTPDDQGARHVLNALEGTTTDTAPKEYVRNIFDDYAEGFESHLVNKLGYQTPQLLTDAILRSVTKQSDLAVLDLGCGTGLMGEKLQRYCSHLAGVDLSPKMIEQTSNKDIYDDLAVGDVEEFMRSKDDACYDIVVAADVFVYIGELNNIYKEAKRLLPPGGIFSFSVEVTDDEKTNFILNETGRYSHAKSYLHELQRTYGFLEKVFLRALIRNQNNQPIYGYHCVYQMPES